MAHAYPIADTIVALSSGAVPSGVAIIRLSGPSTRSAFDLLGVDVPPPRRLRLSTLRVGGEAIDTGLVAWFPAPHSFTGEDCAELQVHGSPAVVRALLRRLTDLPGFRLAEAGEFTRRAFENGKLDLTEVEGLSDLIQAETETQRRQAVARLGGDLSRQVSGWRDTLLDARAEVEARLDFSDEGDVAPALPLSVRRSIEGLLVEVSTAIESVARGRVTREGYRVALAGPPNVGKSSLLNALAKSDLAIVSDEPGTTRDVREVPLDLDGRLIILVDLAGLRETESRAEAEGVRRATIEIETADLVLWLCAPGIDDPRPELNAGHVLRVATKADIAMVDADVAVSVFTQSGLPELLHLLSTKAELAAGAGYPALVSRERDRVALLGARDCLSRFLQQPEANEFAADDLREASLHLERLLGRIDVEHVLGRLFGTFCIGK